MQERKQNRYNNFDYATKGAYFITICTKDKKCILSHIVGGDAHIAPQVKLFESGVIVEKYIKNIIGVEHYVIMPNHIHLIIRIQPSNGTMRASSPTQAVSQLIKSFKIMVTKKIGHSIFLRSFYDRIIRNEEEYQKIYQYILENPHHWQKDEYYV